MKLPTPTMKSRRFACTHVRVCVHACVRGGQGGHDMSTSPRPREKVKLVVHFSVITFGSNRLTWCSCRRNEGGVCLLAESLRRSLNPSFINTSPSQIFKSSLKCRITGGWGGWEGSQIPLVWSPKQDINLCTSSTLNPTVCLHWPGQ